ncbi:DUF3883 domain-containing protein (plasmid) [Hymenobacter sp. BRD67]|nr:DUF3883 domain-containing protein [Hymenobacter sp. BRD67]
MLPPVAPLRERAPGGSGGAAGSRESQQARDRIGRQAEERAWVWLREQGHPGVTWVSANAQKVAVNHPAHNPHGSDVHHYDLHYLNELGEQVAVEVKGTSGSSREFYLSREELAFAECQPPDATACSSLHRPSTIKTAACTCLKTLSYTKAKRTAGTTNASAPKPTRCE